MAAEEMVYDVVIVGGGPSGTTAALYAARADLNTLVVDKSLGSGALGLASKIANYPGMDGEISGAELLQRMRKQAESFGAVFVQDKVQAVDLLSEQKSVYGNAGTYPARAVVLATGAMGRNQKIEGEDRLLGRGVSYCATCDAAFYRDEDVAVLGKDDEAVEEALFLTKFVKQVYFICPTMALKAQSHLVRELADHPKVKLYTATRAKALLGEESLCAVQIANGSMTEEIAVSGAFVYLQGGKPITDYIMEQVTLGEKGGVVVDAEYQTSLPGVYAVGDLLEEHVRQVVVSAAEGAVAAIAVEKYLRGRETMTVDWSKE